MHRVIPKDPKGCVFCRSSEYACGHHLPGPDGQPQSYSGYDAYEPDAGALRVIHKNYVGPGGRVYYCDGYDPRSGYWMTSVDNAEPREASVSERAIDRTYHFVELPLESDWDGAIIRFRAGAEAGKGRILGRETVVEDGDTWYVYRVMCAGVERWINHHEICWRAS